jgi:hypothetical protein
MAGFFLLVETEDYRLPGHLFLWEPVLHLLYESAQPNKRLKLAAPGVYGTIPFVIIPTRRRSLGAIR